MISHKHTNTHTHTHTHTRANLAQKLAELLDVDGAAILARANVDVGVVHKQVAVVCSSSSWWGWCHCSNRSRGKHTATIEAAEAASTSAHTAAARASTTSSKAATATSAHKAARSCAATSRELGSNTAVIVDIVVDVCVDRSLGSSSSSSSSSKATSSTDISSFASLRPRLFVRCSSSSS